MTSYLKNRVLKLVELKHYDGAEKYIYITIRHSYYYSVK